MTTGGRVMTDEQIMNKIGKNALKELINRMNYGHAMGLDFIFTNPILNTPSAKSNRQTIINLAIDQALEDGCNDNLLTGFDYRYKSNKNHSCYHIELSKNGYILTHSSGNKKSFPRKALYREDLCTNQLSLFTDEQTSEMKYGILMHASNLEPGSVQKIGLGIPDSNCKTWSNFIELTNPYSLNRINNIIEQYPETDIEKFNFKLKDRMKNLQNNG